MSPESRFRISAYLCVGSPMEDEEEPNVHPTITEDATGGSWCINYCQPSSTPPFWQTSAAGQ